MLYSIYHNHFEIHIGLILAWIARKYTYYTYKLKVRNCKKIDPSPYKLEINLLFQSCF